MLRGVVSGIMALRAQVVNQETIANNLANTTTAAFNRDTSVLKSFNDALMYRMSQKGSQGIGMYAAGTTLQDVKTVHNVGPKENTGNPLDIALDDNCYLCVETPGGIRYTRRGDLERSKEGDLFSAGFNVLGENGTVNVPKGEITILEDGTILSDGEFADKLRLVSFPDRHKLKKEGASLFKAEDMAIFVGEGKVIQGFLEKSSVDPVFEMVSLISTMRLYEAAQKVIKSHDETLEAAINKVGKV